MGLSSAMAMDKAFSCESRINGINANLERSYVEISSNVSPVGINMFY